MTDQSTPARRDGEVEQKIRFSKDTLPGRRDALPEGTFGGTPPDPQGDENRDPLPNAPTIPGIPRGAMEPLPGDCRPEPEADMTTELPEPHQALGEVHEVTATFRSSDAMQHAVSQLNLHGFDRADLSLPDDDPRPTLEANAKPADTESDARQARVLNTSLAASVAAMAAAGITVATGGAAAPAVAAAVLAGGAVGGGTYAVSSAANTNEQEARDDKAAAGTLILSARASTPEKRAEAEAILRAAGGVDIQTT